MSVFVYRRASALAAIASTFAISTFFSLDAAAQKGPQPGGGGVLAPPTTPPVATPGQPPIKQPPAAEVVVDLGVYDQSIVAHPMYVLDPPSTDPSAACPSDPAAYNWSRTWSKADDFGNDTFGAGYSGKLTVSSAVGAGANPDKITVFGELRGLGTIFGEDVTMVRGAGWASLAGNVGNAAGQLQVLGVTVWSESGTKTLNSTKTFSKTFFSADTWITLGIVPVHFNATAAGQLGYHYDLHTVGNSIDLTFNSWGKAYATASAGVDLFLASAGVEGTLTLIEVSVPSHGVLSIYPTNVHYNVNSDVQIESLSGEIDAYAKIPGKKWTMKLVSWPPAIDATFPIIHANNCDTPIQHSSCGDNACNGNENYNNCASDCPAPPPEDDEDDDLPPICHIQPWKCPDQIP